MSELKADKTFVFGEECEAYKKSEADKVIAELKDIDSKNRSAYYKDLSMMSKDVEYQKYKRCLDKAELCQWKAGIFIYKKEKSDFYYRWHKRWLKLAEKFKEAK